MSQRFRPFYVAALAVIMVGLYGTEAVPKSHRVAAPESAPVQSVAPDGSSQWLGPQIKPSPGLLELKVSRSILPFDLSP